MSATAAYLHETVGSLLSQGVAATVASQPADPVEHLANWLLKWVWQGLALIAAVNACLARVCEPTIQ